MGTALTVLGVKAALVCGHLTYRFCHADRFLRYLVSDIIGCPKLCHHCLCRLEALI
jgi:hypothetical protein